jgi:PEP-CTERM motif
MSEKMIESRFKAVIPAGLIGLFGLASASMGQTFIGANATNNWNASADITTSASNDHDANRSSANLVSGVNIDPTGLYSDAFLPSNPHPGESSDWLSNGGGSGSPDPAGLPFSSWVEFTFNQSYNLGGIYIWQDNQQPLPYSYQGMQDCTIDVSNDGASWTQVFSGAIPQESDLGGPNYYEPVSLIVNTGLAAAQYVVITASTTNWNYAPAANGDPTSALDAVEFATTAVPEPASIGLLAAGSIFLASRRRRAIT